MNFDLLRKAINLCCDTIGHKTVVSDEELWNAIDDIFCIPRYKDLDRETLFSELSSLYNTPMDIVRILSDREKRQPWLRDFKAEKDAGYWKFWNRYKQYLQKDKHYPNEVVDKTDDLTDKILDHLFNPQTQDIEIFKKGMVVGHVQSGKTANYTGLICKAADAGFNIIIVLTGLHNNLRSQTQIRIDEGFLGFDTGASIQQTQASKIGVGLIPGFVDTVAHSCTTREDNGDFTVKAANAMGLNFDTNEPIVFVVKKNGSVLKRLYSWLMKKGEAQLPNTNGIKDPLKRRDEKKKINNKALLLIDDEADNASINTAKDPDADPTVINSWIRNINSLFARKAYVGYTATPFANIFINKTVDDDLFPSDFIINMPAPPNYIGPNKVFGITERLEEDDGSVLPIVRIIDDYKLYVPENHKKFTPLPEFELVPNSLKMAIKSFIVTCAIRIARGQVNKHNSMLIHVSRFQPWQETIKAHVDRLFKYYKAGIEASDAWVLEEFRRIFEVDEKKYDSFVTVSKKILNSPLKDVDNKIKIHTWEEIKPLLFKAVQKITVRSINGSSGDALDYQLNEEHGISVIAIGGDKLARGLTLEGLSVSYFLRASKMYDTLMQMGRWFGYRPGYVDLCRLYTSNELNDWYRHIAIANEELREEFNYLYESRGVPSDFALKVRTHPGVLQVTAANKMYNSHTVNVSWAGRLVETYQLSLNENARNHNYSVTDNLIKNLNDYGPLKKNSTFIWRDVPAEKVTEFLRSFKLPCTLKKINLDLMINYIEKLVALKELTSWRIALLSKSDSDSSFDFGNVSGGCFDRSREKGHDSQEEEDIYYIIKNHIVGNAEDEFVDLDQSLLDEALKQTNKMWEENGDEWKHKYPSPKLVREKFRPAEHPLLMLYPLNPEVACRGVNKYSYSSKELPFIGFAIAFPRTETNIASAYRVTVDFEEDDEYDELDGIERDGEEY